MQDKVKAQITSEKYARKIMANLAYGQALQGHIIKWKNKQYLSVEFYEIGYVLKSVPVNIETPICLKVYHDRIEMLTVLKSSSTRFKTFIKTFDYNDLLLMNNTLNLIMRGKQE